MSTEEPGGSELDRQHAPEMFRSDSLEAAVCRVVKQDPFFSVGQIKREVNSRLVDDEVSWFQVFSILRRKGLLRRKARFRYAWGRS